METIESIDGESKERGQRPTFLTVLCVLSFVYIGLSLLLSFPRLFSGPMGEEQMDQAKIEMSKAIDDLETMEMEGFVHMLNQIQRMTESLNDNFYPSTIVSIVILLLGLFSAIKMWQGFKLGFHLYIGYSLLSIIQIYFFVSPADIPTFVIVWNLLISGLFVFMYSRNLKWLS